MNKHRSTLARVANNPQLDNFDPGDALESLHTRIVEIEAIAHAAGEAGDSPAGRRESSAAPHVQPDLHAGLAGRDRRQQGGRPWRRPGRRTGSSPGRPAGA